MKRRIFSRKGWARAALGIMVFVSVFSTSAVPAFAAAQSLSDYYAQNGVMWYDARTKGSDCGSNSNSNSNSDSNSGPTGGDFTDPSTPNGKNTKAVFDYLTGTLGFSGAGAAAIAAVWAGESGNDPHSFEGDFLGKVSWQEAEAANFDPTIMYGSWENFQAQYSQKLNPAGYSNGNGGYIIGLGLAQWTGPRAGAFIKSLGGGSASLAAQLNYMVKEPGYESLISSIAQATDPEAAAYSFSADYEGGGTASDYPNGAVSAKDIYNAFDGANKNFDPNKFGPSSPSDEPSNSNSNSGCPSDPINGDVDDLNNILKMMGCPDTNISSVPSSNEIVCNANKTCVQGVQEWIRSIIGDDTWTGGLSGSETAQKAINDGIAEASNVPVVGGIVSYAPGNNDYGGEYGHVEVIIAVNGDSYTVASTGAYGNPDGTNGKLAFFTRHIGDTPTPTFTGKIHG